MTTHEHIEALLIVSSRVVAILVGSVAVYLVFVGATEGTAPEGWPWSVLTLSGLAVAMATIPRRADRQFVRARIVLSLLVLLFAFLWIRLD